MSNILVYNKYTPVDVKLTKFLTLSEYKCKCKYETCTRTLILASTVRSFTKLRADWGAPLVLNSAFRCERHNIDIGGSEGSFHKIGAAIDIRPASDIFTVEHLDRLEALAYTHFDVVLRYDSFVHCHNLVKVEQQILGEH